MKAMPNQRQQPTLRFATDRSVRVQRLAIARHSLVRSTGTMNLSRLLLFQAICLAAFASEEPVVMSVVRASVSNIYFTIEYVGDTDKVAEMNVTWVAPRSAAEKTGLRKGDRLIAINGIPIRGMKRRDVLNGSGGIAVRGKEVTFAGRRGFLREIWLITASIDAQGNMMSNESNQMPNPLIPPVTPAAGAPAHSSLTIDGSAE
jgi:membrane-associated protease RseP (regulator of RpoE activity)